MAEIRRPLIKKLPHPRLRFHSDTLDTRGWLSRD